MSELLPCPFCGGEAELHPTYDMDTNEVDGWFAWCDNDTCECKPETGQFFTEAEAIDAWNTRAEQREEIVRCRDCRAMRVKYGNTGIECWMNGEPFTVEPDGFCAWGKRRDA